MQAPRALVILAASIKGHPGILAANIKGSDDPAAPGVELRVVVASSQVHAAACVCAGARAGEVVCLCPWFWAWLLNSTPAWLALIRRCVVEIRDDARAKLTV
eukprot:1149137-Pelagomonas_calceolata.AAC.4